MIEERGVILFDGICNLCNASVIFILKHERKPVFQFASMQSDKGRELLESYNMPSDYLDSVVLIKDGTVYFGATAALKIGQTLKFPWSFFAYTGMVIPKFMRDWTYNLIAKHRYQWFGKRDICMVPTEERKARFL
jgi:predicted DCC family thiol-disulfide oxidoreductase YuxK